MRYKFLIICLIITTIFSCPKDDPMLFEKQKIEQFWKWFSSNEKDFQSVTEENREEILDKIISKLNRIQKNLAVEISVKRDDGKHEIIISAEGDKVNFPIVKKIVERAPQIDGWIVTAFRQRANQNFELKINDILLDTSKMFFWPIIDGTNLDVIVYGPNFDTYDETQLFQYGLIVIDNLIGEYDCVMSVRYYDFQDIKKMDNIKEAFPLMNLPEFIDKRKNLTAGSS